MKKKIIPIMVIVLIVIIALLLWFLKPQKQTSQQPKENGVDLQIADETENINGNTYEKAKEEIPEFIGTGYQNMRLNKGNKIFLINEAENKKYNIFAVYTLYKKGEEEPFYVSDLIPSDSCIPFIPSDYLEQGDNNVIMIETAYLLDESTGKYIEQNSLSNDALVITIL